MELNNSFLITLFSLSFLFASSVNASFFTLPDLSDWRIKFDSHYSVRSSSAAPSPAQQITFKHRTVTSPNSPSLTVKVDPKIKRICAATESPEKCISLITPYLEGSVNPVSTLKAIIKMLQVTVEDTSKIAKDVRADVSTSSAIKGALDANLDLYDRAIDNLAEASSAFSAGDFPKVKDMLGAAISNLGYCNDAFLKNGLLSWPLKETNELMIEFAGYGIDISSKLRLGIATTDLKN
ncbi:hypothetical protein JCGZ_06266 [Jatropha curcas]|uniref:Pectinesterase inhibitor domain-containing protein n=1 Tax=Jatropha curcas TaxID=180498 RepID=A0A067KYA4_JATCU|nr:hypothetical protein JCGZ_06266 [Jatropha curcas]